MRLLKTRRLANDAILRITEFAAKDHVHRADLQRRLKQLNVTDINAFPRDLAQSELEGRDEYPVEQFGGLVRLLEERRVTNRETIVVFIAGAVATLLASR